MNWLEIGIDVGIVYASSVLLTWFFVSYLALNAWTVFLVFCFINAFNGVLQTYLLPLRYLDTLRQELNGVKLFGLVSLTLLIGNFNLWILASRFGWLQACAIGFGSAIIGPVIYGLLVTSSTKLDR